jgi:hypothetical protein
MNDQEATAITVREWCRVYDRHLSEAFDEAVCGLIDGADWRDVARRRALAEIRAYKLN